MNFKVALPLLLTVLLNALAQLLVKKGIGGQVFVFSVAGIWSVVTNKLIVSGLIVQACALYCWLRVLSAMSLSIAFPIMISLLVLVILGASFLFLGEKITISQGVGAIFLIIGIFCIAH